MQDADDDVIIEDEIIESEESGSHASYEGHIQDLKARKEELTRQVAEQVCYHTIDNYNNLHIFAYLAYLIYTCIFDIFWIYIIHSDAYLSVTT